MLNLKSYFKNQGYANVSFFLLYLVNPFNLGYIFGSLLIISVLLNKSFLSKLDFNFILLLIFSICYAVFYTFNLDLGGQFIFIYSLFPSFFYLTGKTFQSKNFDDIQNFKFLFVTGLLFSLPAMASVLLSIYDKGFVVVERDVPLIWTGQNIPATNMAAFFVLNMSIPAFLVANFRKFNLFYKMLLITTFVLSIACLLRLGSRTQLSIFFITFLVTLVYLFRRQTLKQNLTLFGILFIVFNLFLSYVSFSKNSDIMSAFAGRMDSKKYGASSAGGRTERWTKSLVNLWEKPLGWPLDEFGFSHNLWLDIARVGGTLCFILLLIFTFNNIFKIRKAVHLNPKNILINTLFICYGMSFYLLFFVEPIFDGYFPVFILYCFFLGIIAQYLQDGKSNEVIKKKL